MRKKGKSAWTPRSVKSRSLSDTRGTLHTPSTRGAYGLRVPSYFNELGKRWLRERLIPLSPENVDKKGDDTLESQGQMRNGLWGDGTRECSTSRETGPTSAIYDQDLRRSESYRTRSRRSCDEKNCATHKRLNSGQSTPGCKIHPSSIPGHTDILSPGQRPQS